MQIADIIQIMLSSLSLIATVAVSFVIYWLQSRHEKEMQQIEERKEKEKLESEANRFLIDNNEERGYLPFCILASNLYRNQKHSRKIYTDYCRASNTLQTEILRQAGLPILKINGVGWVEECFDKFREDLEKYKLVSEGNDFLHDNAKYFHYGYEYFKDCKVPDMFNDRLYDGLYKPSSRLLLLIKDNKLTFSQYVSEYLDYIEGKIPKDKLTIKNPISPVDYFVQEECLRSSVSCSDEECSFYVMYYVDCVVLNLSGRYYEYVQNDNAYELITDATWEYFEDVYYCTLLELFLTYCRSIKKMKGD